MRDQLNNICNNPKFMNIIHTEYDYSSNTLMKDMKNFHVQVKDSNEEVIDSRPQTELVFCFQSQNQPTCVVGAVENEVDDDYESDNHPDESFDL